MMPATILFAHKPISWYFLLLFLAREPHFKGSCHTMTVPGEYVFKDLQKPHTQACRIGGLHAGDQLPYLVRVGD